MGQGFEAKFSGREALKRLLLATAHHRTARHPMVVVKTAQRQPIISQGDSNGSTVRFVITIRHAQAL
jgi:hypothetical protein